MIPQWGLLGFTPVVGGTVVKPQSAWSMAHPGAHGRAELVWKSQTAALCQLGLSLTERKTLPGPASSSPVFPQALRCWWSGCDQRAAPPRARPLHPAQASATRGTTGGHRAHLLAGQEPHRLHPSCPPPTWRAPRLSASPAAPRPLGPLPHPWYKVTIGRKLY